MLTQLGEPVQGHSPVNPFSTIPASIGRYEPEQDLQQKFFRHSDTGNAERLIATHGQDLRYSFHHNGWFVWNGKVWREDKTGEIYRRAVDVVKQMRTQAAAIYDDAERRAFGRWAQQSDSEARIRSMISLARSVDGVSILPEQFDQDPWLLNCQNGVLDLRTGILTEHRRNPYLTKITPIPYLPDAHCPIWEGFIHRAMAGNERLIRYLRLLLGISLTGILVKRFFFVYGPPNTGKSKLVETLRQLLGEYAKGLNIEVLMAKPHGGGDLNPSLARLHGTRMVAASETTDTRRFNEALIKRLTGHDVLTVRTLHKEPIDFVPKYKLWVHGNFRPVLRGDDAAVWERLVLIPFGQVIPPEERDPDLPTKFERELPGILSWAVKGCLEWVNSGHRDPVPPPEFQAAADDYQQSMDDLNLFTEECCVQMPGATVNPTELYTAYREWSEANGLNPLDNRKFKLRLEERGFTQRRGRRGARYWEGIAVVDQQEEGVN